MNIKSYLGINSVFEKENGEKMTHDEMYGRIVNDIGLDRLIPLLPENKEILTNALKEDENLNNIPLLRWDGRHQFVQRELKRIGINQSSLSQTVCILKCAARQYVKS